MLPRGGRGTISDANQRGVFDANTTGRGQCQRPRKRERTQQQAIPSVLFLPDRWSLSATIAATPSWRKLSARSSDKKGKEGIEFGDEWYKRLMEKLQSASDVVCLFTERSLDRPWILFEAGVAKGKLDTPVHGIALGVPLNRVSTGPFYQFQNLDDGEDSLTKLVLQLAKRIPGCEPETDVVRGQVKSFKSEVDAILKKSSGKSTKEDGSADDPLAKVLEEMKGTVRDLPTKVAEAVVEAGDPVRRRRMRRIHPMMFQEIMHMSGEPDDPIGQIGRAHV